MIITCTTWIDSLVDLTVEYGVVCLVKRWQLHLNKIIHWSQKCDCVFVNVVTVLLSDVDLQTILCVCY